MLGASRAPDSHSPLREWYAPENSKGEAPSWPNERALLQLKPIPATN